MVAQEEMAREGPTTFAKWDIRDVPKQNHVQNEQNPGTLKNNYLISKQQFYLQFKFSLFIIYSLTAKLKNNGRQQNHFRG